MRVREEGKEKEFNYIRDDAKRERERERLMMTKEREKRKNSKKKKFFIVLERNNAVDDAEDVVTRMGDGGFHFTLFAEVARGAMYAGETESTNFSVAHITDDSYVADGTCNVRDVDLHRLLIWLCKSL